MSKTLVSDVARSSLRPLLEQVEQPQAFSADQARDVLEAFPIAKIFFDQLWQRTQAFLEQGMERGKLIFMLREFLDVAELYGQACESARAKVIATNLGTEELRIGIARLAESDRAAKQLQSQLTQLLAWLDMQQFSKDTTSLPEPVTEQTAAGYLDMQELATRLRSGK